MRFLVDENLPLSLIEYLRNLDHDVLDVAASRYRGEPDEALWKLAAKDLRILITKDLGFPFPEIHPYPLGLILIRVPDTFTGQQITNLFSKTLAKTDLKTLQGHITVITPGQIRTRSLR